MRNRLLVATLIPAALAGAWLGLRQPQDDHALTNALVGEWQATDTSNAALHRQEDGGVMREELLVRADGTLSYIVEGSSTASQKSVSTQPSLEKSEWGWKVLKGKLLVRDMGAGSTQEWLKPLKFSISHERLTILRKAYPAKAFERIQYSSAQQ